MRLFAQAVLLAALLAALAMAQSGGSSVEMAPPGITTLTKGKPGAVELDFRVKGGFHINSNHPNSSYLIPTTLKLDAPTDIAIGKIDYPPGRNLSFAFAPDEKLNVYSGDFALRVTVHPLHTVLPGKYNIRGKLHYQACDDRACYPPRDLPMKFEVSVRKPAIVHHVHTPRQSPNVHQ